MMFQKFFNTKSKGSILLDITLALSLSVIFVAVISQSSFVSRDTFLHALHRRSLIDSILSTSSSQYIDNLSTQYRLYGNDRIEKDISIKDFISRVSFEYIEPKNISNLSESMGTPLCSVDFFNHQLVSKSKIQITPISLPINPLLPLTDIQVRNNIAYISTDSAKLSDPDLLVVDIKDKSFPTVRSSIDTGPGISAISLAGNKIFAAATSRVGQLQSILLNSLDSISLENTYHLPLPESSTTPTRGSAIFFHNNIIYLGTEKWDGNELNIIDVTNSANPTYLAGYEIGSKVNDIFVAKNMQSNTIAYVADSDQKQLRIFDVTNTQNLILQDSFSPSGWSRQEGNVVSIFEGSLGFGRTSGGFDIKTDPEIFLFSSSSQNFFQSNYFLNIPGGVYGIVQDRFHLYIASREADKEFQIYDRNISTSPAALFSLPVAPQKLVCDMEHLYILSATAPVIYEISFN